MGRFLYLALVLALVALGAAACEWDSQQGTAAAAFALDQVGDRYVWGGNGPAAWDCSGLIHAAYRHAGLQVPRTSAALARTGSRVDLASLRVGDLVHSPGHVRIYVGGGRVVHASNPARGVVNDPLPKSGVTFTRIVAQQPSQGAGQWPGVPEVLTRPMP